MFCFTYREIASAFILRSAVNCVSSRKSLAKVVFSTLLERNLLDNPRYTNRFSQARTSHTEKSRTVSRFLNGSLYSLRSTIRKSTFGVTSRVCPQGSLTGMIGESWKGSRCSGRIIAEDISTRHLLRLATEAFCVSSLRRPSSFVLTSGFRTPRMRVKNFSREEYGVRIDIFPSGAPFSSGAHTQTVIGAQLFVDGTKSNSWLSTASLTHICQRMINLLGL